MINGSPDKLLLSFNELQSLAYFFTAETLVRLTYGAQVLKHQIDQSATAKMRVDCSGNCSDYLSAPFFSRIKRVIRIKKQ
jgi:hypothetical protein